MAFSVATCFDSPRLPGQVGYIGINLNDPASVGLTYNLAYTTTGTISGPGAPTLTPNGISSATAATFVIGTAGTYTVTITEVLTGTIQVYTFILTPSPAALGIVTVTDAPCTGGLGSIVATLTGGNFITANWHIYRTGIVPAVASGTIGNGIGFTQGLPPGNYFIRWDVQVGCVAGGNGAFGFDSLFTNFAIAQEGPITSNIFGTNITCSGTGSILLTPTSGTAPYIFNWTGPNGFTSTTQNLTGIEAGVYNVTITSANGCTGVNSVIINQIRGEVTMALDGIDPVCGDTGYILLTTTSGTGPYTFDWTGPNGFNSSSQDIFALAEGDYTVIVTDANGCIGTETISLGADPGCLTTTLFTFNPTCQSDSGIESATTGGTPPYTYLWSNGATTQDIIGINPGTYTLVVTDDDGNTTTTTTTINNIVQIEGYLQVVQPTTTNPTGGSITAVITNGTAPYFYSWATGESTQTITGLGVGTYTVHVMDVNKCARDFTIDLGLGCPNLSANEFKIITAKIQCCLGKLIKEQNRLIDLGEVDLANCFTTDLQLLWMILQRFYCITNPGSDPNWTCEQIQDLINLYKSICSCDCCDEMHKGTARVMWNETTHQFDIIN